MEKNENKIKQCDEYYFQALLTEYEAIRNSSLSRDTVKQTIENFIILVVSALIASYSIIIKENLILTFPVVSIILTSLAFTRHKQHMLLLSLSEYEKVLQVNLIEFVKSAKNFDAKLPPNIDLLWNWQNYLKSSNRREKKTTIPEFLKRGISSLNSVLPLFVVIMFLFHKPFKCLNYLEIIVFILAFGYSLTLLAITIVDYVYYMKKR
jgi:hypothetical protein